MTLRLVSAPASFSLFACRATASTALPPQTSAPASSIPSSPPLTCALHCPHFQSYGHQLLNLISHFRFLKLNLFIYVIVFFRCSGCTHEFNLHRPVILEDATDFFRKHGVSDLTFDTCKLVGFLRNSQSPFGFSLSLKKIF